MINHTRGIYAVPLTGLLLFAISAFGFISLTLAQPLVPLPASPGSRAAVELLTNVGFETDDNSDKIPDSWQATNTTISSSDKRKCDEPDKTVSHTGSCAFMFRGNADGSSSKLQQTIGSANFDVFESGANVTFSAYIDPRSGIVGSKFGKAIIKFSDESKLKFTLSIPTAEDYIQQSDSQLIMLPDGATITSIKVIVQYAGTSGKFFLDDVSFAINTPETPTPSHTPNDAELTATASGATLTPTNTPTVTLAPSNTPTITPTSTPENADQLINAGGAANDSFGSAVALDGTLLAVGAPGRDVNGTADQGAVYIYNWNGTTWGLEAELVATNGTGIQGFGESLALRGSTLAIGATNINTLDTNDESVFVFTRSGNTWAQQAKLNADDTQQGDLFGLEVALSADGNTLAVGAPGDDTETDNAIGSAYIFTRSGTVWTQSAKLTAEDGTGNDAFGTAVTLDGDTIAIGAPSHEGFLPISGAVYVYTGSGTTWTQQTKLSNLNPLGVGLGTSLALKNNTLLIGSPGDSSATAISLGYGYVYIRTFGVWLPQSVLSASDGVSGDGFGISVALSSSGSVGLVSALESLTQPVLRGSAYQFSRSGIIWSQQNQYIAADGAAGDNFGQSVALNDTWAVFGVPNDDVDANNNQGSVKIFDLP